MFIPPSKVSLVLDINKQSKNNWKRNYRKKKNTIDLLHKLVMKNLIILGMIRIRSKNNLISRNQNNKKRILKIKRLK